jgi:N-ethylmaleimide reductase
MPANTRVLAPSAVALSGTIWTDSQGMQPYPTPEQMTEADILAAVEAFANAAERAIEAGCDGVELHGANGYLIDQFLNTASNRRTDGWGGTPAGRIRFALAVADAVIARIGSMKTGIRISPFGVFNDMKPDADMPGLYALLARELSQRNLAYIHIVDHSSMGAPTVGDDIKRTVKQNFRGAVILSGGYDRTRADADLHEGHADLIAFGRPFISNPDLVVRLQKNLPLAEPKTSSFYTPGENGYIDYPAA